MTKTALKKAHRVFVVLLLAGAPLTGAAETAATAPLSCEIQLDTITSGFDGTFCWFHPRAGVAPGLGRDGAPLVVLTLQKWFLTASDYFSGLYVMRSSDLGATWSTPEAAPGLAWRDEGNGVTVGVCDFTPRWHGPTGKIVGIGHTVRYVNGKLMPAPRPRETAYSICDPATGQWKPWRTVAMPDPEKFFSSGAGCAQWLTAGDGTLLVPFYFKGRSGECYSATVMRCALDGDTLKYVEHGNELSLDVPRGLDEPSIAFFQGRYYMTLRNDVKGYVSRSDDGLHYAPIRPWAFDDGAELGSYNTQQHWVTHSEGLFLAYTRRGADNDHIMRNRAPLFIAQVDPDRLCVLRSTERVLVPEKGATLGNFGVCTVSERETWVTVGEGMYRPEAAKRGADGRVYAARIKWSRPNALAIRP